MRILHKLIALRQLTLDCGVVAAGEEFELDNIEGCDLVDRGLAGWTHCPGDPDPPALVALKRAVTEQLVSTHRAGTHFNHRRQRQGMMQQQTVEARQTGVICRWFQDKGCGFIRPDASGNDVFVHIKDTKFDEREDLAIGRPVSYGLTDDDEKRPRAVAVRLAE
jgi:cold shock CspA family protein